MTMIERDSHTWAQSQYYRILPVRQMINPLVILVRSSSPILLKNPRLPTIF